MNELIEQIDNLEENEIITIYKEKNGNIVIRVSKDIIDEPKAQYAMGITKGLFEESTDPNKVIARVIERCVSEVRKALSMS